MPKTGRQDSGPERAGTCGQDGIVQLVTAARKGSREAFNRLVDRFQGDIFRMVYYRTRSRSDAEDLTQEIFLKAFRNLPRLKRDDRFKSWLYSIAVNRIRDYYRKTRLLSLFTGSPQTDDPVENAPDPEAGRDSEALEGLIRRDFWNQIGLLLDRMSRMEREVFVLRFMDQLSITEISQTLNKNQSTVKTHLYRGLQKLRKEPSLKEFLQGEMS